MTQAQFIDSGIVVPLRLTHKQQRYAARCIGIDRYCYNWMVATHSLMRSCWGSGIRWAGLAEMKRVFNELKHDERTVFITEVSKFVAEGAFDNFRNALSNWLNKGLKAGRPHLKRRRATGSGSFLAANGVAVVRYDGHRRIRLPGLGSVKLRHELPEGVPYKVVIKKRNGRWFASVNYRRPPIAAETKTHEIGGLDVGIEPLAVDSLGNHYENPKAYYRELKRLGRWQRIQARRAKGSSGWHKAQTRIDSCHRRVRGLRENAHHQLSREVVRKYAVLGIETLNVSGMDKLRHQAKAIRDAAIGGLLQKVRYKAGWYGTEIVLADRWYASSKTCFRLRSGERGTRAGEALGMHRVRGATRAQRERRTEFEGTGATGGWPGSYATGRMRLWRPAAMPSVKPVRVKVEQNRNGLIHINLLHIW